jgi:sarcosine oxidase delta subunit
MSNYIWNHNSAPVSGVDVEIGHNLVCWIAAQNSNGREGVFLAHYINRPCDGDMEEQEDYPDWTYFTDDGDALNAVGWYMQRGCEDYFEPLPDSIKVTGWAVIERPELPVMQEKKA